MYVYVYVFLRLFYLKCYLVFIIITLFLLPRCPGCQQNYEMQIVKLVSQCDRKKKVSGSAVFKKHTGTYAFCVRFCFVLFFFTRRRNTLPLTSYLFFFFFFHRRSGLSGSFSVGFFKRTDFCFCLGCLLGTSIRQRRSPEP